MTDSRSRWWKMGKAGQAMTTSDMLHRAWPGKRTGSTESTPNPCYLGNTGKVVASNAAGTSKQNQGGRQGRRAELAFWELKLVKEWHLRKALLKQMESGEKDALRLSRRDGEPREHWGLPLDTKRGITPVNVTYGPKAQLSLQQASRCGFKTYSMFSPVTCLQRRWF